MVGLFPNKRKKYTLLGNSLCISLFLPQSRDTFINVQLNRFVFIVAGDKPIKLIPADLFFFSCLGYV